MFKKYVIAIIIGITAFSAFAYSQENKKATINSPYAKKLLLGRHMFSLQWISWEHFGRADVKQSNGVLYLTGEQKGRGNDDYLKIDGIITEVNRYDFKFEGTVTTKVSHNNDGEPCVRDGEMTFAITGKRKYWRLQEMQSPCGVETDYVDIFLRR